VYFISSSQLSKYGSLLLNNEDKTKLTESNLTNPGAEILYTFMSYFYVLKNTNEGQKRAKILPFETILFLLKPI